MPTSKVLTSTAMQGRLKDGFNTLANLLAVTLGPTGRHVLIENSATSKPELYSDGATIARRIIEMPGRAQNVGLMMMRNLIWETHLQICDGTATAALIAQTIFNEGYRLRAAGANVMDLRRGIERAADEVTAALYEMAQPVTEEDQLVQLALTITGEPRLSRIIGEMFDILGADAHIAIENYVTPTVDRSYHEGGHWHGRLVSQYFANEQAAKRAVLADPYVALFDGTLSDFEDASALLETVAALEPARVAVMARSIRGEALTALITAQQSGKIEIIAGELQEVGQAGADDLLDLAALTGAKLFSRDAGYPLSSVTARDLGRAHRVEADAKTLAFAGGLENALAVRARISSLQERKSRLPEKRPGEAPDPLAARIARLSGRAGTLKIGAVSGHERDVLRQKAEQCLRVLPFAMRRGMLPGGGVAYLNCLARLKRLEAQGEEAWGIAVVARALESPFKRIVSNSGSDAPEAVMQAARRCGEGFGYDSLAGQVVDMSQAGLWDAADVLVSAFRTAVSGAVMALTVETMVLRAHPQTAANP